MEIKSDLGTYEIFDKVAEAEKYRLYICFLGERQCLLQIANTAEFNGELDRAAYLLRELKRRADELEAEYAKVKTDPKDLLNCLLAFPELVDTFICHEQGNRRINILAFHGVVDVSRMVPLTNITFKDRLRVDLRTSAWIMGKLLKLLAFTHNEGIAINLLSGENILIEPDEHYVLIFDWSLTHIQTERLTTQTRCQEISQVAQAVIAVLGGDWKIQFIPNDGEEAFERYTQFLFKLALGRENNANRAHTDFYRLIDSLWEREYYKFTVLPLSD